MNNLKHMPGNAIQQ